VDEIFVSWGTPDKPVADRIIERLNDLGMPVNEYSRRIRAGDEIRHYVVDGIKRARMVLAITSEKTLRHSTWVQEEITLAAGRLNDLDNKLERLVLVRIGPVPDDLLPVMLQGDRLKFLDLDQNPREDQLESLVSELRRALGQSAPFVIPAAVFAMTGEEFDGIRDPSSGLDPEKIARLTALCERAGMPSSPDLWQQMRSRYGPTAADFAPYGIEQEGRVHRLIDVAQGALRMVNENRNRSQLAPLYLKWYSREDFMKEDLRDQWSKGHSLLIVDSLSALNPAIANALQSLPSPDAAEKAAVIYLPPYTCHNVELEELIRHSLEGHFFLTDTFRAWRERSERLGLAFDLPTGTSLRRWLGQFLLALETALEPDQGNVSRMQRDRAARPIPSLSGMPGG
jgi:hypothetical protein